MSYDWKNLSVEQLEWVEVHIAGYHDDFSCTQRVTDGCNVHNRKEATHYVRFGIVGQEKDPHLHDNYFYTCKECIQDSYWEVNKTEVSKS
jgi:hypothetical protein